MEARQPGRLELRVVYVFLHIRTYVRFKHYTEHVHGLYAGRTASARKKKPHRPPLLLTDVIHFPSSLYVAVLKYSVVLCVSWYIYSDFLTNLHHFSKMYSCFSHVVFRLPDTPHGTFPKHLFLLLFLLLWFLRTAFSTRTLLSPPLQGS